jgi:hypothetical protein
MTAKPNRTLLHFLHRPIRSNAAALARQRPRAAAVPARSFVTGVGPPQTFIAPHPANKSEICPMPPSRCDWRKPGGFESTPPHRSRSARFERKDRAARMGAPCGMKVGRPDEALVLQRLLSQAIRAQPPGGTTTARLTGAGSVRAPIRLAESSRSIRALRRPGKISKIKIVPGPPR